MESSKTLLFHQKVFYSSVQMLRSMVEAIPVNMERVISSSLSFQALNA